MAVSADHASHGIADCHAILHLNDCIVIVLAEYLERTILVLRFLRAQHCNACRRFCGLLGDVLFSGCVSESAPSRLPATFTNPTLRIDASG